MTTDAALRSFASFLTAAWQEMSHLLGQLEQSESFLGDWMQANWEILVEAVLLPGGSGCLEVYGDGADCCGASSRIFRPEALPTHRICCMPVPGKRLRDLGTGRVVQPNEMTLWGFVRWEGGTYDPRPPFNAVLLEGKEDVVVDLRNVEFCLEEIPKREGIPKEVPPSS